MDIETRCMEPEDREEINELFNEVFHKQRSLEVFDYFFDHTKCLKSVVYDDERGIAGFLLGLPVELSYFGERRMIFNASDFTLREDLRNRKIGKTIVSRLIDPPDDAPRTLIGFTEMPDPLASIDVTCMRMREYRKKISWVGDLLARGRRGCVVSGVERFDESVDDYWSKLVEVYPKLMVVKDKEYLNWRYGRGSGLDYASFVLLHEGGVVGVCVWETRDDTLVVDELSLLDDRFLANILAELTGTCRRKDLDAISISLIHDELEANLLQQGFKVSNRRIYLNTITRQEEFDVDKLGERGNWHVTQGDTFDIC